MLFKQSTKKLMSPKELLNICLSDWVLIISIDLKFRFFPLQIDTLIPLMDCKTILFLT